MTAAPRLTRKDLTGGTAAHADSSTEAIWFHSWNHVPRLQCTIVLTRRTKQETRTWSVDGKEVRDLDAALAVLNGEISIEEAMVQFSPPAERPKKSLASQIAEVDYELEQRADVYKRIAAKSPNRTAELDLHVETMKAVRATLVWLHENELRIKQRLSY